ncbi:MAG: hypothetical protein KAY90_01345 [Arenimonas sp.]|nr:hypothetical protein [Arenimonas sp.]
MVYSAEQQQILESIGLRLYVRIPAASKEPKAVQGNDGFWQTRLGQNIQRVAQGRDVTALPASPAVGKFLAKRMLWQQLRPLLKPE